MIDYSGFSKPRGLWPICNGLRIRGAYVVESGRDVGVPILETVKYVRNMGGGEQNWGWLLASRWPKDSLSSYAVSTFA